ncbi:S8 family serine peptidase [Aeromicrobium sp. NPDC092404]|uniref:S8 family serine peptidase n=1 Tax=Aeromicrobium sp. NPDC092404 TaxID=3154976 RepID=UPI00344AA890
MALGAALVAATPATAGAADEPPVGASLLDTAKRILSTALPGEPLEVVTTTRTSGAPTITTTVASSRSRALDLIVAGLKKPSTIGVDVAHEVSIDVSNDPLRPRQWALTRFGAETAWRTSTGRGVVVAVIDTGVRALHGDLRKHVVAGRDFVAPGTLPSDENGHGTHVAGIITAVVNNNLGVASLAPGSRVMPLRVLDRNGVGSSADVAKAIVWAVDHGAKVINLSLSSTRSDAAGRAAVAYAISKNVVVVAAAGNDGCGLLGSPTTYPAAYDGVLGVGAITSSGAVASFSNCGSWVDVTAPGSAIVSTMTAVPAPGLGCTANYCTLSGTSMAAPYAAAAAALKISTLGSSARQLSVRSLIQSTADDIGSAGYDTRSGHGVINPRRMLAR